MSWMEWYNALHKPSWTPAPATIGRIWSLLYPVLFLTAGFVLLQILRRRLSWRVGIPFLVNLVANLVFTPIQFGLRNLPLASIDILMVWASIVWMMASIWPFHRWVAWAQLPYLIWVSTATVLQLSMTWSNW